jgi:aspartyl-tRNA(Asn)/glutamyl-tRNA(Gln) amidotransferase subunit A
MTMELVDRSVIDLAAGIRDGAWSAAEVLSAHERRIAEVDPKVHAVLLHTRERAQAQAAAIDDARARADALGSLAGVPYGLKDLFVTEGLATTAGSRILAGWVPPYEGSHARALARAGAVLVGKLSLDEFAMGSSNENVPAGTPCVRNPWALDRVPGGSSGGSAAAVAARMLPFALGTDTGGSIRQPASLCGVVGLKPTYGRVSRFGMIAFASSLDQAGPIARSVRDAALVLAAIAGHDPRDATSLCEPVPDLVAACEGGLAGLRVGVHRGALALPGLDAEVGAAFTAALAVMQAQGAVLVDVELPHCDHAVAAYYVSCMAEAASNLARYDGVRYGARAGRATLAETYEATRSAGFGAEVKRRILLGTFVLRKDSYEAYYGRAQRVRSLVARDHREAFARCDVLASPTSPVPAFRIGERTADPLAMYLADTFTVGANLAGLPAISVPCGFTRGRLPIGLQLVGPRLGEPAVLRAAAGYEDATAWHRERPTLAESGA